MAAQQLASLTDLAALGLAVSAFPASITDAVKTAHLLAASGLVLSYVKKRHALPLASWGQDLIRATVALATFSLMALRGFDPANAADQLVLKGHDDAIVWLRDVSRGDAELVDCIDATDSTDEASPLVESDEALGWPIPSTNEEA